VARIDLVDRELVLGDSLASVDGRGFVGSVACASDGSFLLASLVNARHRHAGTNSLSEDWANAPPATVELVKLALPGLAEVGRVTLNNGQPPDISLFPLAEREWGQGTARVLPAALALSPDDQLAAVPNPWGQGVWLVDVASMAIVDADSTTAGDQPVDLSANAEAPRAAIFSVDGATLYVAHHHDDSTVSVIDVATKQVSTIATGSTGATRWTGWTFTTPEELLLTRRQGGLLALDLAAQTATMIVASADLSGVVLDPNGQRAYLVHTVSNQIDVIDAASHAPIDSDGDTANGITPLLIDDSGFNYAQLSGTYSVAITPF
jgi:YVTN family beta-propeller protein